MTRLDKAQEQFIRALQLRDAMGGQARVRFDTLGALIDCARAYIDSTDALESAEFLQQEEGASS